MKKLLVLSLVLIIGSCSKSVKYGQEFSVFGTGAETKASISTVNADCYADWNNGADTNTGTNTSPKKHIQECINTVSSGQTVIAKPGTYVENINFNGKNITVASIFINTLNTNDINSTIIDGNQNGSVVTIASGENNNAKLTGFTIQNGYATNGGGIYVRSSDWVDPPSNMFATTPTLSYLKIISNVATNWGGGIYMAGSTRGVNNFYNNVPTVMEHLEISGNNANEGGGIYALSSVITLRNTKLTGNHADSGGAMKLGFIDVIGDIDKLYIAGNQAKYFAGGSIGPSYNNYHSASNIRITNSLIAKNISTYKDPNVPSCPLGNACGGLYVQIGGVYEQDTSKLDIINCTFADNKTKSNEGGGLCAAPHGLGVVDIINSVFWGNTKWFGAVNAIEEPIQVLIYETSNVNFAYNNIQGLNSTGVVYIQTYPNVSPTPASMFLAGNIESNPSFIDPTNINYSINLNSPCAGSGTNSISINGQNIPLPIDDIISASRPAPLRSNMDRGAYEVTQPRSIVPVPIPIPRPILTPKPVPRPVPGAGIGVGTRKP